MLNQQEKIEKIEKILVNLKQKMTEIEDTNFQDFEYCCKRYLLYLDVLKNEKHI